MCHIGAVLTASVLTPRYSPLSRAISDLGMEGAPYAWLVNWIGLIVPGMLLLGCCVGMATSAAVQRSYRVGAVLLAVTAIGMSVSGAIPFPAPGHVIAAVGAAIAAYCAATCFAVGLIGVRYLLSVLTFIVGGLVLFDAASWILAQVMHDKQIHPFMGLQQRAVMFTGFIWFSYIMRREIGKPDQTASS